MSLVEAATALKLVTYGARTPYSEKYRKIIEENTPYTSSKRYNPDPDLLFEEILAVVPLQTKRTNIKYELNLSKASVLQFFVAFTDQHHTNLPLLSPLKNNCLNLVQKIEKTSQRSGVPVTVPEQLSLALDVTNGNLTQAAIVLAIATRAMARNYDTNLITSDKEKMLAWYKYVAPFGYTDGTFDPPGDTYHFWGSVLAGMSSQENRHGSYELLTGKICDLIYLNTASATEILRHKVCRKRGNTHETIDILGYNIGRALAHT